LKEKTMERNARLTLVGLGTVAGLILFVILLAIPALNLVKKIAIKNVCGTNLKGLGTAMTVYANDYDDMYPQLPGTGPWSEDLGFPFFLDRPDFSNAQSNTLRNISASLYLLVRYADVAPSSFVCPYSEMQPFDGINPTQKKIIELWDFGYDPYAHVSYAYHNPYGKYPPDGTLSAAFAVMADMSPWLRDGNFVMPGSESDQQVNRPAIITVTDKTTWKTGTGRYHDGQGQNVLYADGHTSWETQPNVGVKNDNIYTYWSVEENPTEQERQGGTAPTGRGPENDAKSKEDSFLAI
jgi:prepilin-type processing-associated H-X9-DG protein